MADSTVPPDIESELRQMYSEMWHDEWGASIRLLIAGGVDDYSIKRTIKQKIVEELNPNGNRIKTFRRIDAEYLADTGHEVDSLHIYKDTLNDYSFLLDNTEGLDGILTALHIDIPDTPSS